MQLPTMFEGCITKTDLVERLSANTTPRKAHTIPASLKRLPVESLIQYTMDRDPDNLSWVPATECRSLWKILDKP